MDAVKFIQEKERMCDSFESCSECLLRKLESCSNFVNLHPAEAIAIVEKWSQEHPQKTMLMDFLEKYPNAILDEKDGTPFNICPEYLGYERKIECKNCPFTDCKNHILNCRSIGKVYVANFDSICRRYITWVLKELNKEGGNAES